MSLREDRIKEEEERLANRGDPKVGDIVRTKHEGFCFVRQKWLRGKDGFRNGVVLHVYRNLSTNPHFLICYADGTPTTQYCGKGFEVIGNVGKDIVKLLS
mgnify:CR=1 FL=1